MTHDRVPDNKPRFDLSSLAPQENSDGAADPAWLGAGSRFLTEPGDLVRRVAPRAVEHTDAAEEVSPSILHTVETATVGYAAGARSTLEYAHSRPGQLVQELDGIDAHVKELTQEVSVARTALATVERYLSADSLASLAPDDVQSAVGTLFTFAGTYSRARHKLGNEYVERIRGVSVLWQVMEDVNSQGQSARDSIANDARHYDRDSVSGIYAAEHTALLIADIAEASSGVKFAKEMDATLRFSPALDTMPDTDDTVTLVDALARDLRDVGHEPVMLAEVKNNFTKVKERIDVIEAAASRVTAESTLLKEKAAKIGAVIDRLQQSPLLAEK
jgi:hypothetical protein